MPARKTQGQYDSEVEAINPNIEVLGSYLNGKTPVKLKCNVCNHIWKLSPNNSLKGRACGICNASSGGFDAGMPGMLYYFRVKYSGGNDWYKIGITNKLLEERYTKKLVDKADVLLCKWYKKWT